MNVFVQCVMMFFAQRPLPEMPLEVMSAKEFLEKEPMPR